MDFEVAEGKVEISRISSLVQHFPVDDPTQEGYEFRISLINNQLTFGKTPN
ncbi:hypothetical protein EfmAA242_19000 [Enterococcus faecium]|nr:hypothetical protein EfmAA242_19000 [Enterococcus faecium]